MDDLERAAKTGRCAVHGMERNGMCDACKIAERFPTLSAYRNAVCVSNREMKQRNQIAYEQMQIQIEELIRARREGGSR